MNIVTIIQAALTALNSSAEVFLLSDPRAQNEELEHTGDVVIIHPDWTSESSLTSGLEVNELRSYNMEFKTLDEWDNSDSDSTNTYNDATSVDRIEAMTTLANSVFIWIAANNGEHPEIIKRPLWRSPEPILRAGNGTMSGVKVTAAFEVKGNFECDFS